MKARKLTLLAAILSAFALAACDNAEDTTAPVEPPVSEAPAVEPSPAAELEGAPVDETNTLPDAADESEFSEAVDEVVNSVTETTEELVESAREAAASASDKVKELTGSAIETTKQATEEAKAKAEAAAENVRQSFSSETGVTNATIDPTAPIEPEVTPLTSGSVTSDTTSEATIESAGTVPTEDNPDLVGEIIEQTEEASAVDQNRAEQALEQVKEAGVEVREAVETDLEEAAEALSPSTEATTEPVLETDSQTGTPEQQ